MQRAIRRRVPLAALALVAPLMLSSSTPAPASGQAGEASREPLACEGKPTRVSDAVAGLARLRGSGPPADTDLVVLNGRGYNYGAADPEQLDRIQLEALMVRQEAGRR
jgi:hypothetical protein